jgi:hypothetical protein
MNDDGFVPMGDTIHVRVEEDLVFIRNFRFMTLADFRAVIEVYVQVRRQHGMLFAMYDSTRSQGVERSARQAMTTSQNPAASADAIAIFGASFAIRTLGNMIDRAFVGLGRPSTGMRFFENEAQARAYLNEVRSRLKARH